MTKLRSLNTHFVLGYSGCDEAVGEAALSTGSVGGLVASNNGYDWLGTGVYFWEGDSDRAWQWADEAVERHRKRYLEDKVPIRVRRPFVVGAVIKSSTTLDLATTRGVQLVNEAYHSLKKDLEEAQLPLPANTSDRDMKGRYRDFQVINYACLEYCRINKESIDTVRGIFPEGKEAYPGAGFSSKTHVQLCVREPELAIVAYFRVRRS